MSAGLDALRAGLVRLSVQGGREPHGVDGLIGALGQGIAPAQAARAAGLDAGVVAVLSSLECPPTDVPGALLGLSRIAAQRASADGQLRASATYPTALALSVVLAGMVVVGLAVPAAAALPGAQDTGGLLVVGVGGAVVCLLGLAAAVGLRTPLPGLSVGWRAVESAAFVQSVQLLVQLGVPFASAVRASAAWCTGAGQLEGLALARSLDAGEVEGPAGVLLSPFERSMLQGAAQAGAADAALTALVQHHENNLKHVIPVAASRVHLVSLLLAGGATLAVGRALFEVVGHVAF